MLVLVLLLLLFLLLLLLLLLCGCLCKHGRCSRLQSPMGPDHDLWKGARSYDQGNAAAAGNPWLQKPALTLLGAGLVLGGLGMRLARI